MKISLILFSLIFIFSCNSKSKYQLDEKSEMAQMMLDMHTDLKEVQTKIKSGEDLGNYPERYNNFASLDMTDESMREDGFEAYATQLIESEKALYSADSQNQEQAYKQVVNNCLACHTTIGCRGPIPKIKKLQWKE